MKEAGFTVDVVDAIGLGMTWPEFEKPTCGSTSRATW